MMHRTTIAPWLLGLVLLALSAGAQLPSPTGESRAVPEASDEESPPTADRILGRRTQLRPALEQLGRRISEGQEVQESASLELEELQRLDRLLALQLEELRLTAGLSEEAELPDLATRFGHPPPYSVVELDLLLDELEAASAASEVSAATLQQADRALESARQWLQEVEEQERIASEEPPASRILELRAEAALEQVRLRKLQQDSARSTHDLRLAREQRLEGQQRELRSHLLVSDGDLEASLATLEAKAEPLGKQLEAARESQAGAERRRSSVREQVELAAAPSAGLLAHAEAARLEVEAARERIDLLAAQRERLEQLVQAWRLRFRVLAGEITVGELTTAAKEVVAQLEELESERRLVEAKLGERRLALGVLRDQQAAEAGNSPTRRWLDKQEEHLREVVSLHEQQFAELTAASRLMTRLANELETRVGQINLGERLSLIWERMAGIWNLQVIKTDSTPITIGKLAEMLLLLLAGYVVSRLLSRHLGQSILPRFGLTKGAALAFQTLAYYVLLAVFFLWALRLVNIPLTVFTVVGGVLAIGLGFGSQNIMNNFISGLIILAEHPIKVGDLIDIDGVFGQVERIGPRSSRIRAGDNTHVIVPNSAFLEKNVLNWTVSDDVIRTAVDVGVAYGSPVEKVSDGLERAVTEDPDVMREPAAEILFMDFGDNALAFRIYFWVRVTRPLDLYRAQSRLRFRIDKIFRETGIVIAFPQRDVHFDSLSPLEIRMVGGDDRGSMSSKPQ